MRNTFLVLILSFVLPIMLFAKEDDRLKIKNNAPPVIDAFISILDPTHLNSLRVNIENSEDPDGKISKTEIDFGDGFIVTDKVDVIHEYALNKTYNVKIRIWDNKNAVSEYTKEVQIQTNARYEDSNTSVFGPQYLEKNRKYSFNLNSAGTGKLYKIILIKDDVIKKNHNHDHRWHHHYEENHAIEINNVALFTEKEINSDDDNFIEKYVQLKQNNILISKYHKNNKSKINIQIKEVNILLDTTKPVITSDLKSNSLTRNSSVQIKVNDESNVTTYVWDRNQNLLMTSTASVFNVALNEGLNYFVIQSIDSFGNKSDYFYLNQIIKDTISPQITTTLSSEYIYSSYPQNITFRITANEQLQYLSVNALQAQYLGPNEYSFTLNVQNQGTYNLEIVALDLAGNETRKNLSIIFNIDNLAPVISSNLASNSITNTSQFLVTVADNSETSTEIYKNDVLVDTTSSKKINLTLSEGLNYFLFKSQDIYNNSSQLILSHITLDTVKPDFSTNQSAKYYFKSFPSLVQYELLSNEALSAVTASELKIQKNTNLNYLLTDTLNQGGSVQRTIEVADLAGNKTSKNINYEIIFDDGAPLIEIGEYQKMTSSSEASISISVTDNSPVLTKIKLNGNLLSTSNENRFLYTVPLTEGLNRIELSSVDSAGNASEIKSIQITKDSVGPILSNILPSDGSNLTELSFAVSGSSNKKLSEVKINGLIAQLAADKMSFQIDLSFSDFGAKDLVIEAKDLVGNTTTQQSHVFLQNTEAPKIATNLTDGATNVNLIDIQVSGVGVNNLRVVVNGNEVFNENTNQYHAAFPYGDGLYNIDIYATNSSGKQTYLRVNPTLDTRAPFINLYGVKTMTTSDNVPLTYNFYDVNPAVFRVFVNQEKFLETTEVAGDFSVPLPADGVYAISVGAVDSAGNISEINSFEILKDSTAPVITILTPQENDYVNGLDFKVKFKVDDKNSQISATGSTVVWNANEGLYEASYSGYYPAAYQIVIRAENQLGLISTKELNIRPLTNPLESSLIGLYEDAINKKVVVRGAAGTTRPGLSVDIRSGFFSHQTITADQSGSFMAWLDPRDQYKVSVTDPFNNQTYEKILTRFNQEVILSGQVRDQNDQPIQNVKVTIGHQNLFVYTDAAGVFSFNKNDYPDERISGDQVITIDGQGVTIYNGTDTSQFSVTKLNVTLSLKQNNIIQKPIYLYPVVSNSTSQYLSSGGGTEATFTSSDDPGVSITVASDTSAVFPSAVASSPISIYSVSPDKLTIPPPVEAMPDKVIVFEPSGTVFSSSVQFTAPNTSAFPAKTSMILILFNSNTGKWEVGGAANVSDDGQSIQTKPDQGLRHFSAGYFIPAPPDILTTNVPDQPGADSFSGAVTNKIELPSFKVLGNSVMPSLVYKSTWAKPSVTVTNIFNFPEKETLMNPYTESGTNLVNYTVDFVRCDSQSTFANEAGIFLDNASRFLDAAGRDRAIENARRDLQAKNKLPSNCHASPKVFYNNIDYKNSYSDLAAVVTPKSVRMSFSSADIHPLAKNFQNIPRMAQLSQFIELKNEQDQYLSSGIYPYIAHYDVNYDKLITGTVQSDYYSELTGAITEKKSIHQTISNQIFGSDLISSLFVQNFRDSEAGQGWKIAGIQKIVNPSSEKIMLEEADGSISTYSPKNSIITVADLNTLSGDLTRGIGLNQWPDFAFAQKDSHQIMKAQFGNGNYSTQSIGSVPEIKGRFAGYTYYNYTVQGQAHEKNICDEYFLGVCIRQHNEIYYDQLPRSTCQTNKYDYQVGTTPAQFLLTGSGAYVLDQARHSLGYVETSNFTKQLGYETPAGYASGSSITNPTTNVTTVVFDSEIMSRFAANVASFTYTSTPGRRDTYEYYNGCGSPFLLTDYFGTVPAPDPSTLNSPASFVTSPDPNILIIADAGNHRLISFNTQTQQSEIIAGDGTANDNGENVQAKTASFFYPRGMVFDAAGNLYVSTKMGHIRKIDTEGIVTTIAGNALNGQYLFEADPLKMKFNEPYGLAFDNATNSLFVADTGYHRIVKIDLNLNLATTVAGNGQSGFSGDGGSATEASLSAPTHILIDSHRNLIIADSGNNRIRSLSLNNSINTDLTFVPSNPDHSTLTKKANGSWQRTYRNGQKELFNSSGAHLKTIAPNDLETSYFYDNENRLEKIILPNSDQIQYNYAGNRLDSIMDPAGRSTRFSYNSFGQLTKVIYPNQSEKNFNYTPAGLMVQETNQKGFVFNYIYNAFDRLQKITLSDDTEIKLSDSASKGLIEVDASGVFIPRNATANNESITDANGNQISMVKDVDGYISKIIDPRGRVQKIKRDLEGRPIEVTDVDGSVIQNTYDLQYGDLILSKNVDLDITTQKQFNAKGLVISETDPYGKTTIKTYNDKSQLTKETFSDGRFVALAYNSLGLIAQKSSFSSDGTLQVSIQYEYDPKGNLVKQIDQNAKYTEYTYDQAGRVTTSKSNINSSAQAITQFEYDSLNNLTKVISPKGEVTEYSYSLLSELTQVKDPNNKITIFDYNTKGLLTKKTDAMGFAYEFEYDNNGNQIYEKDPNGQIKRFSYNSVNKINQIQLADDTINYTYNIKDAVVSISTNTSTIQYQRDSRQRVTQETVFGNGITYPSHTLDMTYSKNDLRTSLQSTYQNITYGYDSTYRLTSIQNNFGDIYQFGYDEANRMRSIARPGSRTDFSYDAGSSLTLIQHSAGNTVKSFSEYTYDARNFITQKRSPASTENYTYDLNGQLTSVTNTAVANDNEYFSYDALGNRLTYNGTSSTYDQSRQRIQDDGTYVYVYDNNGNIIYKSAKSNGISYAFDYTATNQLRKVSMVSSPLGGAVLKTIEYKYDPMGRRIQRVVADFVNAQKSNTKKYYYDGDNILSELDADNRLTASYTHSPLSPDDILSARFFEAGIAAANGGSALTDGQVLASTTGSVYYLKNHLNTITDIIDATGSIIQKMNYSAFGVLKSVKNASGVDLDLGSAPVRTSFSYTGREYEPEMGMYYYRARYYDPSTGRFLQQDPDPGKINNPITVVNRYAYTGNNPVMYSDPSGRIFGWDDVAYILITALAQTIVQNNYEGGNFLDQFVINALVGAVLYFGSEYVFNLKGGYGMSWSKAGENFLSTGLFTWGAYAFSEKGDGTQDDDKRKTFMGLTGAILVWYRYDILGRSFDEAIGGIFMGDDNKKRKPDNESKIPQHN